MNSEPSIIVTSDGSHSLLNEALNETYHSVHGALRESQHVFIENGLNFWLQENANSDAAILEIGFGTGLNAILTLKRALEIQNKISYATVEVFPLRSEIWSRLNYGETLEMVDAFNQFHQVEWNEPHHILPNFLFQKYLGTIQSQLFAKGSFDLIYFDAFAPSKQPEIWEMPVLEKVTGTLKQGGVFVTYCAKGQLKRDLKALGLTVETLPGPPGKKEMVRARKCDF